MVAQEALPREATALTTAIQPLQQQSVDCPFKAVKCPTVIGDSKVIEMSPQLPPQCLPEFWQLTSVTFLAQPLIDRHQGTAKSLLRGLALQSSFPIATPTPVMGEAEEIKAGEMFPRFEGLPGSTLAKCQQLSFLLIESQSELCQSFRQDLHKALCIVLTLKHSNAIVCVPDQRTVPATVLGDDRDKPLVEHSVEEHVGNHRRDNGEVNPQDQTVFRG